MPLATIYSEPLSEILEFMDHWSDNFTAEMVLKAIGYHALGLGTTRGGAAVTHRDLAARGHPGGRASSIADGSGLSRDDRVTARELTTLLVKMWNDPTMRDDHLVGAAGRGAAGHAAAPPARHAAPHARSAARPARPTSPRRSRATSGRRFAFVTIENGHPVDYWAAHTAEDGVVQALLAELRRGQ